MRLLTLGIVLSAASVLAAPAPQPATSLGTLEVDELPELCRDLARAADATMRNRALSARISLASCLVDHRLRDLVLCDCEQSVLDVEAASAQSIAV